MGKSCGFLPMLLLVVVVVFVVFAGRSPERKEEAEEYELNLDVTNNKVIHDH